MPELLTTPLHALHISLGAKMGAFAGYDMPIQYPTGVLKEHLHVRQAAGLFDVSHMGQLALRPRSGGPAAAAAALERLVPMDVLGLAEGRQRYGLFTDRRRRDPRRPDVRQPRRPSVPRGQRRLQGRRRRAPRGGARARTARSSRWSGG